LNSSPDRGPGARHAGRHARNGAPSPAGEPAAISRRDQPVTTRSTALGPLALLVGLDLKGDALSLGQRFEPGAFNGRDVHEDVAPAVIRLDEAVAALGIEEFNRTGHGHRGKLLSPWLPPPAHGARRLGRNQCTIGDGLGPAAVTPPPHSRRNVKATDRTIKPIGPVEKVAD